MRLFYSSFICNVFSPSTSFAVVGAVVAEWDSERKTNK